MKNIQWYLFFCSWNKFQIPSHNPQISSWTCSLHLSDLFLQNSLPSHCCLATLSPSTLPKPSHYLSPLEYVSLAFVMATLFSPFSQPCNATSSEKHFLAAVFKLDSLVPFYFKMIVHVFFFTTLLSSCLFCYGISLLIYCLYNASLTRRWIPQKKCLNLSLVQLYSHCQEQWQELNLCYNKFYREYGKGK